MSLIAGTVWQPSGGITFNATTTGKVITTNGANLVGNITFNGVGGGWTLGSALAAVFGSITVTNGTFDTSSSGNYSVTVQALSSSGISTRTINLNASTIILNANPIIFSSTLTFNAGTSQINSLSATANFSGAGFTFYNVSFTSTTAGTKSISGANTFNNLSVTAPSTAGVATLTFSANQTINGTLSTTGTAGNRRVFFASATYGIGFTLTCNSAASLTDADFRDIYVIGTAAPISGTRIGNRGNCSGITFSTPKTVYANLTAASQFAEDAWATSSGGTPSLVNFPLPQDTAIIDNASGSLAGFSIGFGINYIPTLDMSLRTTALSFSFGNATTAYGNFLAGSGLTFSGSNTVTFSGGTTQTITSAGKTFTAPITVDTYGGTVQLADALNIPNLNVTNGTFTTAGFAVTAGSIASTNSNVRSISLGASTVTLTASGGIINFSNATNFTFNAGTSTILMGTTGTLSFTSALTFYNFSITGTGNATVVFTGGNTFNNLTISAPSATGIKSVSFSANQTINGTLTCAGASAVRRIFVQSDTIGTQRTLTAAAISADDCDFRDIVIAGAAAPISPTRAGDCGGNSGITFPSPNTVYWNLAGTVNWSATGWCTASGGTPAVNNFPLAQDTAVFDNTGSAGTVTIDATWNIGTFDASLRTSAMTFNTSTLVPVVYGNWLFGTGVTSLSNSGAITFSKNGTQTITSNGVQFGCPVTINHPLANVQLADALSLISARTLTLTSGTFDAVTYNVTIGAFNNGSASNTLKMGSGTWTLSGTATIWNCGTAPTIIAGTSTIVLSDTSAGARTFTGGGLYYNKLTIGGATGTSTLTFTGSANTFGELASTKTVAHTIAFGATNHNFGKWSVTGTVGNVVTITGTTTTSVIAGPAVTGVDYLAMGTWGISTTSPGEFYAGANSTGTAAAPVFRTAAPAPRTLYWVGGTGNWSSTTKWDTTSGGGGGAAIPMSLDTVTFDSLSNATAYTATIDAGVTLARCAAFTMAGPLVGNVTFAGTVGIAFHGNVSFAATGITRSYTGAMNLAGNSSYTFTTNGVVLNSQMAINGIGSTWTLGSALSTFPSFTVTYGSFSTSASNYALAAGSLSSNNSNVRSILLNGSTLTGGGGSIFFGTTAINLTFNAGTSTINHGGSGFGFNGGEQTFYNVSITTTGATATVFTGSNTFNNLTFPSQTSITIGVVQFSANQTINGTLTLGAGTAAAYRTFLASDTIGTTRTLTVNALAAGAADIDFRDITIAGTAAPLTGTRFGDAKGNSGITFPAAKTVYYRQTGSNSWGVASTGSWSATSGGALDATMFPLAQDTAVFPAATYPASGSTTTINASYNIGTIDMSLRTSNTMTLATGSTAPQIYGNWINGTGITISGTGAMTFAGRGSQTITSAGKTFTQQLSINTPSGSVTFQDAFVSGTTNLYAFSLVTGTLDANGYNVTQTSSALFGAISSTGSLTRTIAVGAGTWITAATTAWNITGSSVTITGTGTISLTSASTKTFFGGGISYSGITLNQGGAGTLTISFNNTFANITNTSGVATTINLAATTQTVGAFTAAGTAGNLLTIIGQSATFPATLIYTGVGAITGLDYLVPTFIRAYPTTSTWFAGANSTNGGSLGWIFTAAGGVVYAVFITESATALDSISATLGTTTYSSNIAESNQAFDTFSALATLLSNASETARASETNASKVTFGSAISDSVTVTDSASVKQTFKTDISDTVNASDSIAGDKSLSGPIVEQATASETNASKITFRSAASETARATDSIASRATMGSSVNNTVTVTDSAASIKAIAGNLSESVTAQDAAVGRISFPGSISESVTAQDTATAAQRFASSASESATAQDAASSSQGFGSSVAESATASETVSSLRSLPGSISESATAQDSVVAKAIFQGIIEEVARGSDQFSTSVVFLAAFSEFAQAYAESVGYLTGSRSISESSTASDTTAATNTLPGSISESATGTDQSAASLIWVAYASEQAAGLDSLDAPGSIYNATVTNTVGALDTPSTNAIFYAAVIAYAGITDIATARFLWELIDDSQTANWVDISSMQSVAWSLVDDSQGGTWTLVNDSQTTSTGPTSLWYGSATNGSITLVLGSDGNIARSVDDGQRWSIYTLPYALRLVVWSNGAFYISDKNTYFASSIDGLNWTQLTNPPSSVFPTSIMAVTVICDSSIGLLVIAGGFPFMSYDGGFTWTEGALITLLDASNAIWDGSKFVLAARVIRTSTNGLNWTVRLNIGGAFFLRVYRLAWSGSLFVATFWDPLTVSIFFRSYTSPDGITWTNVTTTYGRAFTAVSYVNGQFVFVAGSNSQSAYYTSLTGTTTPVLQGTISSYRSSPATLGYFPIAYVGTKYVLPGIQLDPNNNFFYTSTNLTTFTPAVYLISWNLVSDSQNANWQNTNNL
jgi:hypothetical protein